MGKNNYFLVLSILLLSIQAQAQRDDFRLGLGMQMSYRNIFEKLPKTKKKNLSKYVDNTVLDDEIAFTENNNIERKLLRESIGISGGIEFHAKSIFNTIGFTTGPSALIKISGPFSNYRENLKFLNAMIASRMESFTTHGINYSRNNNFLNKGQFRYEIWLETELLSPLQDWAATVGITYAINSAHGYTNIQHLEQFRGAGGGLSVGLFAQVAKNQINNGNMYLSDFIFRIQFPNYWKTLKNHRNFTFGNIGYIDFPIASKMLISTPDGRYFIELPGTSYCLEITAIVELLSPEINSQLFSKTKKYDAAAMTSKQIFNLDNPNLLNTLEKLVDPYIPDAIEKAAPTLIKTAAALSYGLEAKYWLSTLQGVYSTLGAGKALVAAAAVAGAEILAVGDILIAGVEALTTDSSIEYLTTGRVSTYTWIRELLATRELVATPELLLSKVGSGPQQISHEDLLQQLQDAREDTELPEASRTEANRYIQITPSLRYLDHLEAFAKTVGFNAIYGLRPHEIAEVIVQKNPRAMYTLNNVYGLFRDEDDLSIPSTWSIDATAVKYGPTSPVQNPTTLVQSLFNAFRSTAKIEARTQRLVFNELIGTQKYLDTQLRPIIWSKN